MAKIITPMSRSRLADLKVSRCRSSPWFSENAASFCTSEKSPEDEERERELAKITESASIDEPPTTCCRSGCANCVFIVWAERLSRKMDAGGSDIVKKVMDQVDDPSLKAYLEMELRIRGLVTKK